MHRHELFRKSEVLILKYRAKQLKCTLTISAYQDEWPENDFDFGDAKSNAEYLERFETGELLCAMIEVQLNFRGIKKQNHLGMCHLRSASLEDDINQAVNDHDMIDIAKNDLTIILDVIKKELL